MVLLRPLNNKYFFICSYQAYLYPLNKQNNRIWSDSRPLDGTEVPVHDQKVLAWCLFKLKKNAI